MTETETKISLETVKLPFWAMDTGEVFRELETGSAGLKEKEISWRGEIFGSNSLPEKPRLGKAKIVFSQLKSPLILILVIAGSVTAFLGEWVNTLVIFAAVAINTFLGFWQEYKAEKALELLKSYIRVRARVRRDGGEREVDAQDLMPGDIIRISQGDRVPADARLFFVNNFETDESILTGESLPAEKSIKTFPPGTLLSDRSCMVFGGTLATQGFGDAVVVSTGIHTEFGKIASLVEAQERESTPLQRAIAKFSSRAGLVLGLFVFLLFGFGLGAGYGVFDMFLISVAVAVSAVPEGLPVALTVILAVGVNRLARRRGVVRRLLAAETLGSTDIILTDKTGTLTEARMAIAAVIPHGVYGQESEKELLRYAILDTDVVIENPKENFVNWRMFGKSMEVALVRGAGERGVFAPQEFEKIKILDRLPFSSQYKFSAVIAEFGGEARLVVLGAPEFLIDRSVLIPDEKFRLREVVDKHAFAGERILGVASKEVDANYQNILHKAKFEDMKFEGFITFRDPLRPGVGDAIRRIAQAGVKTIIVTGDHKGTADAVARELGMIDGKGAVLTGEDLYHLTKEELRARAPEVFVYARVTPEQKVMLTKLYQEMGAVVAVTGDGVNDAPALQAADIGVAVGSGTDVAKSSADLVMLDDNFEILVAAIEEGRKILENIRKVIVYLLSDSLDEICLIGGSLIFGLAMPLNALQILFVNFFSDSFPAVALAFEDGIDGLGPKPKKINRGLFDRQMQFLILVIGVLTSLLLFVLYYSLLKFGFPGDLVRTFIFASFATYALFLSFSVRSLEKSIIRYNPFSNLYLVAGAGIGLFLTALVIYVPFLQKIFGTVALPLSWLVAVFGMGILNIAAVEFGKWLFRNRI